MSDILRNKVKSSGLKYEFLSKIIGINNAQLSYFMHKKRDLPYDKETVLNNFLNKYQQFLKSNT